MSQNQDAIFMFIGTYTRGANEGIYTYRLHLASGILEYVGVASGVENPSFLALHPHKPYLYAVSEVSHGEGKPQGGVSAFVIDFETGALSLQNQQLSGGAGPCYVSVDHEGKYVLVANYGGGSVAILPIGEHGQLLEASDCVQHEGSSVDPRRQEGPHAHAIVVSPDNRYAFAPDLGLDKIMTYRLDRDPGKLIPNDPPWTQVHAGAGPRHLAFHPNGRFAYVIDELDSTLIGFAYDGARGTLNPIQTISTLPEGFDGTNYCADVHVHPSGKFLYGSNRGHDSIVIYSIEASTGQLTCVGHESTQGEFPRNFALDPTGHYLFAANQNSDTIVSFQIDSDTGCLEPIGHVVEVPRPVCIKMPRL